jgi:hypothetical protein
MVRMRHAGGMRIGYLLTWQGGELTGPFKKMRSQAATWSALGHEVRLFVVTGADARDAWQGLPQNADVQVAGAGPISAVVARRRSFRAVATWAPDVLYVRHGVYAPGLGRLLARQPSVLEVNGDDVAVARNSSAVKAQWTRLTRRIALRRATGAIFMTQELADRPGFRRPGLRRLVLPNSIDLASTGTLPPTVAHDPRVALIGHPQTPWHGTDKLAVLGRAFPMWHIDVIGPGRDDVGADPPPNVELHGELAEPDYLRLMALADAGIGSLAMHRVGTTENPALKVREYLALGLPVILGCLDPDFPDGADFMLRLPNTETNVADNLGSISRFVESWQGRRVQHEQIRHLDVGVKEAQRLGFLEQCCREWASTRNSGRVDPAAGAVEESKEL